MNTTIELSAAPTAMQPGGYVPAAFADRTAALTPKASLEAVATGNGWRITLSWACAAPVRHTANETDRFPDACAVLAPLADDAPWITMGAPEQAVEGFLWKADREQPWRIRAEGLGTVQRSAPPDGTRVSAEWSDGRWQVVFEIPEWAALATRRQIAVAVWAGASQERAGLKSVSPGWLALG
ncbi:MAG: hypothetical protein H7A12_12620 [Pseudomonadales bacterium]|jgi:DMSO reductase family type II enzyme heme b subunit|nr:hypothetical protein [Pseudomonadales bacterium]MCP5321647.1 hypothetical protein [Pseudomonadales bacterium]MCP5336561.1 hypothetical protein [Pseudomonadales bacterium]